MGLGKTLARLNVVIGVNTGKLDNQLRKASNKVTRFARKSSGQLSGISSLSSKSAGGFTKMAGAASLLSRVTSPLGLAIGGVTAVGVGLVGFMRNAVNEFAEFEDKMVQVKAKSHATGLQFSQLTSLAKKMGSATRFSAIQVASSMEFLAQAGLSANDVLTATPGIIQLATAANMDLARAGDIATNIMSQFGIKAKDLGRVNNVLVATTTSANTNIEQLSEAFKYLGPTARSYGVSLEETAAVVGILGISGLQGTIATQALGTSLIRLAKPTKEVRSTLVNLGISTFDATGKFVGMHNLMEQIEDKTKNMTQRMRSNTVASIFGARAYKTMNTLLETGSVAFKNYTDSITGTSAAIYISSEMLTTTKTALLQLNNSWSTFKIEAGDSTLWKGIVKGLTSVINSFTDLISEGDTAAEVMQKVADKAKLLKGEEENKFKIRKSDKFKTDALYRSSFKYIDKTKGYIPILEKQKKELDDLVEKAKAYREAVEKPYTTGRFKSKFWQKAFGDAFVSPSEHIHKRADKEELKRIEKELEEKNSAQESLIAHANEDLNKLYDEGFKTSFIGKDDKIELFSKEELDKNIEAAKHYLKQIQKGQLKGLPMKLEMGEHRKSYTDMKEAKRLAALEAENKVKEAKFQAEQERIAEEAAQAKIDAEKARIESGLRSSLREISRVDRELLPEEKILRVSNLREELDKLRESAKALDFSKGVEDLDKLGVVIDDLNKSLSEEDLEHWVNMLNEVNPKSTEEIKTLAKDAAKGNVTAFNKIIEKIKAIRSELTEAEIEASRAMSFYLNMGNELTRTFEDFFSTLAEGGKDAFTAILDSIKRLIVRLLAAAAAAAVLAGFMTVSGLASIKGLRGTGKFLTVFKELSGLVNLPKFGEGGYVTRPTLAVVGEKGPEHVIPDRKLNKMANDMSGRDVYLHGNFSFNGEDFYTGLHRTTSNSERWRKN